MTYKKLLINEHQGFSLLIRNSMIIKPAMYIHGHILYTFQLLLLLYVLVVTATLGGISVFSFANFNPLFAKASLWLQC